MLLVCVAVILVTAMMRWISGPDPKPTTRFSDPELAEA